MYYPIKDFFERIRHLIYVDSDDKKIKLNIDTDNEEIIRAASEIMDFNESYSGISESLESLTLDISEESLAEEIFSFLKSEVLFAEFFHYQKQILKKLGFRPLVLGYSR